MKKETTKKKLLIAARDLIAKYGFHNVSTRDICSHAKVNHASIHYHYGGKAELYRHMLSWCYESIPVKGALPTIYDYPHEPEKALTAWINWYMERILGTEEPAIVSQLLSHELKNPTGAFEDLASRSVKPMMKALTEIVETLLTEAGLETHYATDCTLSIAGQCLFYLQFKEVLPLVFDNRKSPSEDRIQIAKHIACFSLAGIKGLS